MSNFQKILDSFSLRDTLNPKIWDNPEDPKDATLIGPNILISIYTLLLTSKDLEKKKKLTKNFSI
jgi:hypothetical protein